MDCYFHIFGFYIAFVIFSVISRSRSARRPLRAVLLFNVVGALLSKAAEVFLLFTAV